jgi:hypothetical protein
MTKRKGPLITLAAGLALAAVLMVMNLSVTRSKGAVAEAADTVASTAVTTAPATTAPAAPAAASAPPPGGAASPEPGPGSQITYAGYVNGDGATVAIALTDGKAIAYLCDGSSTEAWLQGTASGGSLDLTGPGEAKLTGTYRKGVATGNISAAGRQYPFSAKPVAPPSGLYRASANVRNAQLIGGWIVLANGKQVGLVQLGATRFSAPPLDTATRTAIVEGATVTVAAIDGSGL